MMADSMDDPDIEQSPDFRQALKLVLKQEIHFLLRRLSETGEESLVITASLGDGEVTQLGSGKGNEYFQFKKLEELKKDFLLFCRDPDSAAFQKKEEKEKIVEQDKPDIMETSIPTELPLEMGVMDDTVIKVELNPDCIELERVQISSLVPTDQTVTMESVDETSTDQALNYAAASLNSVTVPKEGTIKKPEEDQQQVEPFSLLNSFSLQPLEQKKDMTHQGHRSDETQVASGIHVAMETWNEPSQGKKSMIQNLVTPHTKSDVTFVNSLQIKQEEEAFLCETEGICDNNKIVLDFSDMDILPSGSGLDKCGGPQQFSQDKTIPEHDHMFVTGSFQSSKILDTQRIPESQETVSSQSSKSQTVDKDQTLWSDYIGGSHHLSATARNSNLTGEPFLETTVKGQSWKGKKMGVEKFRSQSSSSNTIRILNEDEEACVSEMVTERSQPRLELQGQRSTGSLVSKLSEKPPVNVPFSRSVSFSLNRCPETHANRHLQASHSLTETVSRDLEVIKTQSGKGVKNSLDMIDLTDETELQESTQSDSLLQMKNPGSIPTTENIRRYTEKVKTPNTSRTDFNVTAISLPPPQYQGQSSSTSSLHTAQASSTHTEHKRPNKLNTSNNLSNMFVMVGKKAKCLICNTHLISVDYMKTHLRNHIGYKPYKCNYCGRSFADNSNLRRHIQTHTGERPYACNNCGKTFLRNTHLRKHSSQCVSRTTGDVDST